MEISKIQEADKLNQAIDYTIKFVNNNVKKKEWTNEEIDEKLGRRSIKQIIQDGDTCYMASCLDTSLVAMVVLSAKGMDPVFLRQDLVTETYQTPRIHFAIEFDYKGHPFFLDFNSGNTVFFRMGKYQNLDDRVKQTGIERFKSSSIDLQEPAYIALNYDMDLIQPAIEEMKSHNTPETFKKYAESLNNDFDWRLST